MVATTNANESKARNSNMNNQKSKTNYKPSENDKPRDNNFKPRDNSYKPSYPKSKDFQRNTFADKDDDNENKGARRKLQIQDQRALKGKIKNSSLTKWRP